MTYNRIVISSGHGKYVRGASGIIDEVDEARKVVENLAEKLEERGIDVEVFHDDTSHSQGENLDRIVDYHNSKTRDLDISVHFNAYEQVSKPMGTEVLYVTQSALAEKLSSAIASCGFINRGAKHRSDLAFLNGTEMPAVLLEVCFVDSEADCDLYAQTLEEICAALADVLGGEETDTAPPERPERPELPHRPDPPQPDETSGHVSWFGGPDDQSVSASEGLAFISDVDQKPELFLPSQPPGTTGLARRLNPQVCYCAMRFDYDEHSKTELLHLLAYVRNPETGFGVVCIPSDWGPHQDTGRLIDVSPAVMRHLGLKTDDLVEVIFPYGES